MTTPSRELRLTETFVGLLSDHQRDFESFACDVENVHYHHTPIDDQQANRCGYVLRSMGIRLLTIHNCIQTGRFDAEMLDMLAQTKYAWVNMKNRMDSYLGEVHQVISQTSTASRPVCENLVAQSPFPSY